MRNSRRMLGACLLVLTIGFGGPSAQAASRVFYDDFEKGNTDQWRQDDYRNRCRVVNAADDALAGPYAGKWMASCNWNGVVPWNDPAAFETLKLPAMASSSEIFYRVRLRVDRAALRTVGSAAKILRFYSPASNSDLFAGLCASAGLCGAAIASGWQLKTYWGGAPGDTTNSSESWHEIEFYFSTPTGTVKVWHDGILVREHTGVSFGTAPWSDFYLVSNFSDPHDADNKIYFDDIEVFTDVGGSASGSMSEGTVSEATLRPNAPSNVIVQ